MPDSRCPFGLSLGGLHGPVLVNFDVEGDEYVDCVLGGLLNFLAVAAALCGDYLYSAMRRLSSLAGWAILSSARSLGGVRGTCGSGRSRGC